MNYFSALFFGLARLLGALVLATAVFVAAGFVTAIDFLIGDFAGDLAGAFFSSSGIMAVLLGARFFGVTSVGIVLATCLVVFLGAVLAFVGSAADFFAARFAVARLTGLSPQISSSR